MATLCCAPLSGLLSWSSEPWVSQDLCSELGHVFTPRLQPPLETLAPGGAGLVPPVQYSQPHGADGETDKRGRVTCLACVSLQCKPQYPMDFPVTSCPSITR